MMRYQNVLFDLDGTLTDPKIGITKSVQYALAKFGILEPDLAKLEFLLDHHCRTLLWRPIPSLRTKPGKP
ncbi:HAD hydrolase-like protein [Paenibacillus uliginis]|uniref:HAD hydrolase-like protein n=1 Tax=Paenibacillus uliginis TaxID=683737 RepID=UPI0026AF6665